MTLSDRNLPSNPNAKEASSAAWWEKLMAIAALINLVLVLFNLSYIPLRERYLRHLPRLVTLYDPIKGIEPNPVTQKYLHTVDELAAEIGKPGNNLRSPAAEQLLASLRNQSTTTMIEENPFMVASQFATFATIQQRIRQHVGTESAKAAFEKFWSSDYFLQNGALSELAFFNGQLRPLIQTNYFRAVDKSGHFIDNFWQIDLFFIIIFGFEFLIRTFFISRQLSTSWFYAMLRRWYDIFLFLPILRPLRAISVVVRLHQAGLANFERGLVHMAHEPLGQLSDRLAKFMIVRFINQAQNAIEQGEAARFFFNQKSYIQVNDINEVEAITDRLMNLTVNKVLPRVQPHLQALMNHTIEGAFKQSNFYQSLQQIPALRFLPKELVEQLATNIASAAVNGLATSYSDSEGREIFERMKQDFNASLRKELQDKENLQELQSLLSDMLEEVKLNYVLGSTESEAETTLAEVEHLHQVAERAAISAEEKSLEEE